MKALFDAIDCVLPLLEPYDAYEKCSPDHEESTGTIKNDTRQDDCEKDHHRVSSVSPTQLKTSLYNRKVI